MNNEDDDLEFNNNSNDNDNNNNVIKQKLHKQQSNRFEPTTGSYRRITQIMSKNKLIKTVIIIT
jgi:hypothetical protein